MASPARHSALSERSLYPQRVRDWLAGKRTLPSVTIPTDTSCPQIRTAKLVAKPQSATLGGYEPVVIWTTVKVSSTPIWSRVRIGAESPCGRPGAVLETTGGRLKLSRPARLKE
jgi:hypothetical protein